MKNTIESETPPVLPWWKKPDGPRIMVEDDTPRVPRRPSPEALADYEDADRRGRAGD